MAETSTTAPGNRIATDASEASGPAPTLDVIVVCVAVGLTLAYVPFLFVPSYTPRLALVVLLSGPGIVGVARRATNGDYAARVAAALSAWIVVSAISSGHALSALIGVFGRESSAVILVGSLLAWGAAREVGSVGRQLFERLLVWALLANAVVGLVQVGFNIETGSFQLYGGRATGLPVSHVAFGACMAGAAVLVAARNESARKSWDLGLIGIFAAMANLSGSRFALVAGLVATAAVCVRRAPRRRAVLPTVCYLGGFAASVLATALFLPGESATDRAATAGAAGRLDAWGYGLRAVFDRPVLGWGPGRFRAAVQGRFSAGFTAANARDEVTQIWWDAHNIVVNTAVTLGIVGVGMAAIFGFLVVARARGPLAWFAGTVASSWLLQPAGLATLPLVLFCLGAASVSTAPTQSGLASDGEGRSARTQVARVGLLLGLAGALLVVLADVHVKVAAESGSADEVAAAARHLAWDPVVADLASEAYLVYGSGPTALDKATIWADKAVDRERDRPYYLNRLAALQLAANELETARHTLDTALAEQPWNVTSWTLLGVVAERTDDDELGGRVAEILRRLQVAE